MPRITKTSTKKAVSAAQRKPKDPKASHLYTDDNPSTTIKNTGFKDAETARKTLKLIDKRSLTYQFQTVNTLFYRAKHHPHHTTNIESAMNIFETWLKDTYPKSRGEERIFKPLLSKAIVGKHLPDIKAAGIETNFADVYVDLAPRKRLANTLVDPVKPENPDWDIERYNRLCELVPDPEQELDDHLWNDDGSFSRFHLQLVSWAWSPAPMKKLV